jgi:hypothetical protein
MHKLDRLLISASFLIEPIGESTILTEVNFLSLVNSSKKFCASEASLIPTIVIVSRFVNLLSKS